MRESDVGSDTRQQMHGVLLKKPVGHQSSRWSKRFFVVKDGFLMYYVDSEKKEFDKKKLFNIHPKGVIPLGGSLVEPVEEQDHPFTIRITSGELSGTIDLAAESGPEREKWMQVLQESARITWSNAQLGDAMIERLENQGLQMAKEKQDYFDKLQYEAMALHDERIKTEELEKVKEELEKEKQKTEMLALDLKEEYEKMKREFDETTSAMNSIAEDKSKLNQLNENLQHNLEKLEKDKEKTLTELNNQQSETLKLSQEKQSLSRASEGLQETLKNIEVQTEKILQEKAATEERLKVNEERAQQLEEEKNIISEHADELKVSMKELIEQKAITEAELKDEIIARMDAEKRLKSAEDSLNRLDKAVQQEIQEDKTEEEIREEMKADVKTLKSFFENLAFEAKLDADKPVMIKNAIHARKACVRRAKTLKYEACKKRRSKERASIAISSPDFNSMMPDLTSSLLDVQKDSKARMRHSSVDLPNAYLLELTEPTDV